MSEAELSQQEQPHRTTVVSTQNSFSMVKTTFALSFVIAMSTCFSYRNSKIGRRSFSWLLVCPAPSRTQVV
jgi:hypothetical protein